MIQLCKEKVLQLHSLMARATGGSVGLREEGLLESALETAFSGFGSVEFYPSVEEKGARLGYSLISNHAFVDGNKRIAATLFLWFMQNNGILYRPDGSKRISDASLVALTLMIAESHTDEMDTMVKVVVSLINRKN